MAAAPQRVGAATVVLVEGESDRIAVTTLARRRGHDLAAHGIAVLGMGGATNVGRYVSSYLSPGVRLAGLCDQAEARYFRRALHRVGLGRPAHDGDLAALGFFVCAADLEDELIRALGPAQVEAVVAAEGELAALRTFQQQPAQRDRPVDAQLRRFLGTHSGRKAQYARALVEALEPGAAPTPLLALLDHLEAGEVDEPDIGGPNRLTP